MDRFADAVFVLALGTTVWCAWIAVMVLIVLWNKGKMDYPIAAVWSIAMFLWTFWVIVR